MTTRRTRTGRILAAVIFSLAGSVAALPVVAQTFPSQPLRLIVPLAAGGIGDVTSRLVAEKMGERLGQRIVVENMPGAGGIAAARAALQPNADGHTMFLLHNGIAIAAALFKSLPYDAQKDFTILTRMGEFEFFLVTRADGPHKTLADFVKAAKANPGKLNVGSILPGSTQHLTSLLFKSTASIDFQWVPFKTTPDLLVALLRGDIDLIVESYPPLKGNIDDGKLRALAATSAKRSTIVPGLPSAPEAGAGNMDVVSWNAIAVKAGTPQPVMDAIVKAAHEALADDSLKKRLLEIGIAAAPNTPTEMAHTLKSEIDRWSKVIADNNVPRQ